MRDHEKNFDTTKKIITVGHNFLDKIDDFGEFPVHIKIDVEGLEEQVISQVANQILQKYQVSFLRSRRRWINIEPYK